jgi:hypothetical protein
MRYRIPNIMRLAFGLVALVGLVISATVHLLALSGMDVLARFPHVWLLHVGIFIVFIPYFFSSRKTLGSRPTLAQIRTQFPDWVVAVGACLFAYTIVNFFLFMHAVSFGSLEIHEGKFLLMDHGKLIRELTAGEFASLRSHQVRGFSGHWMFFYFVLCAYFLLRKRETSPS